MAESTTHGDVDARFEPVAALLADSVQRGKDVGAGLCVYQHGRPVIDLAAGVADPASGQEWRRDTTATLASTSKALTAGAALLLVDRGELELDAPVARYWPEFAANGKSDITVRMVLGHTSGVVTLESAPLSLETLRAGTPITDALAAATPEWPPGTAHGYHGTTFGHLVSEIVRRITGQTVGAFFASEIAEPYGLGCFIGLPDEQLPRLATMIPPTDEEIQLGMQVPELAEFVQALATPGTLTYRALWGSVDVGFDTALDPRYVQVESPGTDAVADAASLARYFAMLIGEVDGARLWGPSVLEQARTCQARGKDQVLLIENAWALGFWRPGGPMFEAPGAAAGAFGHGGVSGSFAFADPEHALAFAYVPNRCSELLEGSDQRSNRLIEATYACLDGSS